MLIVGIQILHLLADELGRRTFKVEPELNVPSSRELISHGLSDERTRSTDLRMSVCLGFELSFDEVSDKPEGEGEQASWHDQEAKTD